MKKRDKRYKRQGTETPRESGSQQDFGRMMELVRQFPSRGGPVLPAENSRWNQSANMPQSEIHETGDGTTVHRSSSASRASGSSFSRG